MNRRIEMMVPSEIDSAISARSLIYMPLGTIEFHGAHLPVGLDGLTAHGICLCAAERTGGLVLPPLFYGVGGGHAVYPWTIMVDESHLKGIIDKTISRLREFNVRQVVIFTGHFSTEQLNLITNYCNSSSELVVQSLSVSMYEGAKYAPDHAGIFETTLLSALQPGLVQIELLPPTEIRDTAINEMGAQRHDPTNPLFGIFGPDPRNYDKSQAADLLGEIVEWLVQKVDSEFVE